MIRINLLTQKKPRRADKGQQTFMLGVLIILLAGAGMFFLVHKPLTDDVDALQATNHKLERQNADKQKLLKGEPELKAAVAAAQARRDAIAALEQAAVNPAWMLRDLGRILTPKKSPTMTAAMAENLKARPQLAPDDEFDPRHVWVTGFSEKEGNFKLLGGAQSEGDITELAKRLDASVFFEEVQADKAKSDVDKQTGINYFTFTITGKVVY